MKYNERYDTTSLFKASDHPERHMNYIQKYKEDAGGYYCPICHYKMNYVKIGGISNYVCRNMSCSNN